jgi:glutamine---fructose-6-phosphate transaminase (isomerizing)
MDRLLESGLGHSRLTLGSRTTDDIAEQPEVLARVLAINTAAIERARGIIASKRLVRLVGIGSSKHAAGYGARALDLIAGVPATVLPAPSVAVSLPRLEPSQPHVVLSQSGRTPAILDAASRIREAHVDVIAITNEPESPLEEIATVTLRCEAGIERVVAATKSVTAQMLLVRALAGDVDAGEVAAAAHHALQTDVAPFITDDPPSAIVSSGFAAGWIADEIALKFTEMAGLLVTSEDIVEHFHGPHAARANTLAFLDPSDPNANELGRSRNVRTVGVGSSAEDAIVTVILGQRIAHAWALKLGEDPDADRGLQKVTRTH